MGSMGARRSTYPKPYLKSLPSRIFHCPCPQSPCNAQAKYTYAKARKQRTNGNINTENKSLNTYLPSLTIKTKKRYLSYYSKEGCIKSIAYRTYQATDRDIH